MIIIAISSQKGGVGKTTVSINLAHAFARSGRKTLLLDADPQGSVGLSLTRDSRRLPGFYDYLGDPTHPVNKLLVPTRLETFSLIPAGQRNAYELSSGMMGSALHRVRTFFDQLEQLQFEVCLVDTAAGLLGSTQDILTVANAVLVPQQAEPLGIRSVPKMMEALAQLRRGNPRLRVLGVLLTMLQGKLAESRQAAEDLRAILPPEIVLDSVIPRDDLFIQASARGLPIGVMEEGAGALAVFDSLRHEIERKLSPKTSPKT